MSLLQKPSSTPEEIEQSKPLDIAPEAVNRFDEDEWYAKAYRGESAQLTVRALLMGTVLGFLLSFTNLYVGLKTGIVVGVVVTACIASFAISTLFAKVGVWRTPLSILESACMASTASSAGYATGTVLVSAIPAMLVLSANESNGFRGVQLPWYVLGPWILCLAALGVVMAIPMKRNMINREKLTFPTGTAAAVTLQSLYSHAREAMVKARALMIAAAIGALLALFRDLDRVKFIPEQSNVFDGPLHITARGKAWPLSAWNIKLDHSLLLVAAGAIIGLRTTLSMMAGGLFLAVYLGPRAMETYWTNPAGDVVGAVTAPQTAWKEIGIVGAAVMVAYGLVLFGLQWRTIVRAFSSFFTKRGSATDDVKDGVEVPSRWFVVGTLIAGACVAVLAWQCFGIPIHLAALAVLMTFFLGLVASRATGETDFTPSGAMGKIMQLTYGVLIPQNYAANLITASITSGAAISSSDLLSDLKCGYLLGANPRRQFVAQLAGIFSGTVASVLCYFILIPDATAITGVDGKDPAFAAPAAQQWRAVAQLFQQGIGNLHPMSRHAIIWGVCMGVVLALSEFVFPKWKKWMPSATGFGLGIILPFYYPIAMFLGAFIAWIARRVSAVQAERFVVPVSSGLLAGESLLGVVSKVVNTL